MVVVVVAVVEVEVEVGGGRDVGGEMSGGGGMEQWMKMSWSLSKGRRGL